MTRSTHTPGPSITAQQFYDMVAIAFTVSWNEENPRPVRRSIHSANYLLWRAGVYAKEVRDIFDRDTKVAGLFNRRNTVVYLGPDMTLEDDIWAVHTHFLIVVPHEISYNPTRLLGAGGYRLVLTAVGQEYASSVMPDYQELITLEALKKARDETEAFFRRSAAARAAASQESSEEEDAASAGQEP
jgi:hypothetical protein